MGNLLSSLNTITSKKKKKYSLTSTKKEETEDEEDFAVVSLTYVFLKMSHE